MTLTRSWRLVCLAQGDAPPLVPAGLARLAGAQWQARTLDGFLAEVDAGATLPDAVLAFGGEQLIRALRSHDRTCVLPVFLFAAAEQPAPPGWDGSWSGESPEALAAVAERADWSAALPALRAPLDSLRREHRFARWLAARGHCQTRDAEAFGLDAPRSTLRAWQECGWVSAAPETASAWRAGAALRPAAAAAALVVADAPPASAPIAVAAPLPDPPADPAAESRAEPAPESRAEPAPESRAESPAPQEHALAPAAPQPARAAPSAPASQPAPQASQLPRGILLVLSAFLIVLAALIWTGDADLLRRGPGGAAPAQESERLRIGDAQAPPQRTANRPDPSAPAPAAADAAAGAFLPAAGRGESLRTIARGTVRRDPAPLLALSAGRVSALLAAPGALLEAGSPVARLSDPRAERELERLQQELVQVDAAIEAARRDDAAARALADEQSELERARLAAQLAGAETLRAQAQEQYARSLRLAEDGVLSFREVRPDWEALQRAREAEERARLQLEDFAAARAQPASAARGAAPAWLDARRARVEGELQTARALAAPRLVRAAAAGELLEWRVAVGGDVEEGAEVARIGAGAAFAEAALDREAGAPESRRLGEVEARLAANAPWAAVSEFELIPAAAGPRLRARLPAEMQAAARAGAAVELRCRWLD